MSWRAAGPNAERVVACLPDASFRTHAPGGAARGDEQLGAAVQRGSRAPDADDALAALARYVYLTAPHAISSCQPRWESRQGAALKSFDCLECGACCFQRRGTILISDADLVRWKRTQRQDILERLEPGHFGQFAFQMGEDDACTHHGTSGQPHACRIYEERADVCREFAAGSQQCLEFRRDRGIDPPSSPAAPKGRGERAGGH